MSDKKIYSVYDNGKRIGSYNANVAEQLIGIPEKQVAVFSKKECKYLDRYSFEPEEQQPKRNGRMDSKLANDWDFTVMAFKAMVGRG